MELMLVTLLVALMLSAFTLLHRRLLHLTNRSTHFRLPPGPKPLPILGNLLQLGYRPHWTLAQMARSYGPVMSVSLGNMLTVVVSSSAAAREMFRDHDAALSGRMVYEAMRFESTNEGSIITAQLGVEWRMLRRLCTTGFFATARLDAMANVRCRCVDGLVRRVADSLHVDLGRLLFLTSFNHTGNLVMSRDLLDSKEGKMLFYHAGRIMELVGKPNVSDFIPALRRFDPQGVRKGMDQHIQSALNVVSGFLKERVERRERVGSGEDKKKDLLDVLLDFEGDGVEEPKKLSSETIVKVILEIFIAGIDTTAGTMEWAMAELINHPEVMSKAQAELRGSIAADKEHLEERDVLNLPYLKGVINETLRLHPPLPFLVPHKALKPCTLLGYHVPQETQILVNVWGIGRDPNSWVNPDEFKPERFVEMEGNNQVDYKGHHFEFLPFGSGRRKCPAIPLVSRLLPLVIGSLLHFFDWELPNGQDPTRMDMRESMGISLRKGVSLSVVAVPHRALKAGR